MAQNLFPNEYKAFIQLVGVKVKIKTQIPENSPLFYIRQNIYLPNRFYLTFPNDDY